MSRKESTISTIVQGLVAVNVILMSCGITRFENVTADVLYALVSFVAMVVAWGYGVWTNHNFTLDMVAATNLGRKSKAKRKEHDLTVYDRMVGDGND